MRICRLALITTTAVITGNYRSAPRRSMNAVRGEERRSQPPSREEREREREEEAVGRKVDICDATRRGVAASRKDHDA